MGITAKILELISRSSQNISNSRVQSENAEILDNLLTTKIQEQISLGGSSGSKILYDKSAWEDISDFTVSGDATLIESGGKLILGTTTTGLYDHHITFGEKHSLEKYKIVVDITIDNVPSATDFGLGIGVLCSGQQASHHMVSTFGLLSNTATRFIRHVLTASRTVVQTSTPAFVFSQGDNLQFTVDYSINKLRSTFLNKTTGTFEEIEYTFLPTASAKPNIGNFVLHALGGTYTINRIVVSSNEYESSDFAFVGDSKLHGYRADSFDTSAVALLQAHYGNVINYSGGTQTSLDVLSGLSYLISLKPKNVVLRIGSNDERFGITFSAWQTNYDSIVAQLKAAGISVIHFLPFNESEDLSAHTTHINDTYSEDTIVDVGTLTLNVDGVHPDQEGHNTIATEFITEVGTL